MVDRALLRRGELILGRQGVDNLTRTAVHGGRTGAEGDAGGGQSTGRRRRGRGWRALSCSSDAAGHVGGARLRSEEASTGGCSW
jgi:hypothetical protein